MEFESGWHWQNENKTYHGFMHHVRNRIVFVWYAIHNFITLNNFSSKELLVKKNHIYCLGYDKTNDIPINLDVNFRSEKNKNAIVKIDDGKLIFKTVEIQKNVLKLKATN